MSSDVLAQILKDTGNFRRVMEAGNYWNTPSKIDCLRYAATEAGEMLDAWIREQRPGDSRMRNREHDLSTEVADILIMTATALGPEYIPALQVNGLRLYNEEAAELVDSILYQVGNALFHAARGDFWRSTAEDVCLRCLRLTDLNVVRNKLRLMFNKHCGIKRLESEAMPWLQAQR